jgi:glycosyltransferase involved in cell wall biosynthesis
LLKTIQSILTQSFKNYEYIIIDGGSTDNSINIIKEHAGIINSWISESDTGVYNAMNKGIRLAAGEYCLFLNSGDYLVSNEILKDIFSQNRFEDFIYGDIIYHNEKGDKTITSLPEKLDLQFFYKASLWHQATFIKRDLFDKYGEYDENNSLVSDWQFFMERIVFDKCSYQKINKVITFYDMYNGLSVKNNDLRLQEMNDILYKKLPDYALDLLNDHMIIHNELNAFKKSIFYRAYRKYKRLLKGI